MTALSDTNGNLSPHRERQKISAVVISYNRRDIIGTCLKALLFADELIVVDKSSTDGTDVLAASIADRVISVPWGPVVEETRAFAVDQCVHDWIICLDDDECLSVDAVRFIVAEVSAPRADIYALPQRHYILGVHDESSYYWPEYQPRLFRRGSVDLLATVHGGIVAKSEAIYRVPFESGACIHHLSHKNVAQWIEKANRYTSHPDRLRAEHAGYDLAAFAHANLDTWLARTASSDRGDYPTAVAILRSVYDVIDRVKIWESEAGLDGNASFQAICRKLEAEYASELKFVAPTEAKARIERVDSLGAPVGAADEIDLQRLEWTIKPLREALRHVRLVSELALQRANDTIESERLAFGHERRAMEKERLALEKSIDNERLAFEQERRSIENERLAFEASVENDRRALEQERRRALGNADRIRQLEDRLKHEQDAHLAAVAEALAAEGRISAMEHATLWKMTYPVRRIADRVPPSLRRALRGSAKLLWWSATGRLRSKLRARREVAHSAATASASGMLSYPDWSTRFDTPSAEALARIMDGPERHAELLIIVRFDADSVVHAPSTIAALRHLVGVAWSAVIGFDRSCSSEQIGQVKQITALLPKVAFSDAHFQMRPGRPILFVAGGAVLRPHGPWAFLEALARTHGKLAYADEDFLGESGSPADPWFKPRPSRLLLEQDALLGRVVALQPDADRDVVDRLLDPQADVRAVLHRYTLGLPDGDIVHVPHVLFHNTMPLSAPLPLAVAAAATDPAALVSIIIPTRDRWDLLGPCLASIFTSNWPRDQLDIIVVDNGSTDPSTLGGLEAAERAGDIRVIRDSEAFNFARLINTGARAARGAVLLMLNNDTEVLDTDWIRKLVAYSLRPEIGAVGAKLLYPDRTVQHAGVVCGIHGGAGHAHVNLSASDGGYFNLARLTREILAVTGACIAVRRETFERVGELDEAFRVAFNDVVFCLDVHALGLRNIYLAEPLLIHHESKTRGFDDTPAKVAVSRHEAQLAWLRHPNLIQDDPSYSPSLSLDEPYNLAIVPRRRPIWNPAPGPSLKIMMLSSTHARGHGVAVVIEQQVNALLAAGHRVVIAGPVTANDLPYPDCVRIEVHDPRVAAMIAVEQSIDLIMAHTPPFFRVVQWIGGYAPVIAYDYGEPPPHFFPDALARRAQLADKDHGLVRSTRVLAISEAVAAESRTPVHAVMPLGNAHLGRWDDAASRRRAATRTARGWQDRFVVLNVCRFHFGERFYKGLDLYIETLLQLQAQDPELHARTVFVLCGKGDAEDISVMTASGLTVLANVSDGEMAEIYAAADAYANFSRWEGYNLGIGQALALGLPVVASDIPAHRAFGVPLAANAGDAARALVDISRHPVERRPRIWEWAPSLAMLVDEVESLCLGTPAVAVKAPREIGIGPKLPRPADSKTNLEQPV